MSRNATKSKLWDGFGSAPMLAEALANLRHFQVVKIEFIVRSWKEVGSGDRAHHKEISRPIRSVADGLAMDTSNELNGTLGKCETERKYKEVLSKYDPYGAHGEARRCMTFHPLDYMEAVASAEGTNPVAVEAPSHGVEGRAGEVSYDELWEVDKANEDEDSDLEDSPSEISIDSDDEEEDEEEDEENEDEEEESQSQRSNSSLTSNDPEFRRRHNVL